ncbi:MULTISPECIES: hypothetical protein [Burkholderia cepacia complex]|uniref:hypothetical protein n=1 Tax=Burkholderia cepacia complex TaxID=87882 RepID=UPI0009C1054E|nr:MULTISPECIES: hypothetical protein [Burkholderia cepacia complex]RQU01390.1 hypothetical protein DF041_03695 [Burkholderia cepacia]
MKFHNIMSADLPEIDESIKECVNQGRWLLFKSEVKSGTGTAFYLKAGQDVFELGERGEVLREFDKEDEGLDIDELYYFSDLPKPDSLSNANLDFIRGTK